MQDIIQGFNLLLVEELSKRLPKDKGWTVEDLGPSHTHLIVSSLLVTASANCQYNVRDRDIGFPFDNFPVAEPHHFRLDLSFLPEFEVTPTKARSPAFHVNQTNGLLSGMMFYSKVRKEICEWKPGDPTTSRMWLTASGITYKRPPHVFPVCNKVVSPIEDPLCHEYLARKVYDSMVLFVITGIIQPDH